MGTVKYTGPVASFHCPTNAEIRSLKVHFSPKQEGTEDPSPENVRPIVGWDGVEQYCSGKNIGHIVGYSAASTNSPSDTRRLNGSYGNTISTIEPEKSVTITQTQWPESSTLSNYKNGYFAIVFDNLIFNQYYDFSFKITNITNNPLNASMSNIRIGNPYGSITIPVIDNETLIFKNVLYKPHSSVPLRSEIDIYNCGMSFTLSDIMVTPANMNDGIYESYHGSITNYEFGVLGKNKFDKDAVINNCWIRADNLSEENPLGTIRENASGYTLSPYITVFPNTVYTIKYNISSLATAAGMVFFSAQDADSAISGISLYYQTYINPSTTREYYTFTTPINCHYVRISTPPNASNIQLELGSTATTYEPYNPNHTVYGGWVDLISGEVCEEWVKVTKKLSNCTSKTIYDNGITYYNYDPLSELPCYANAADNTINGKYSKCSIASHSWNSQTLISNHYYVLRTNNNQTRMLLYLLSESVESDDTEFEFTFQLAIPNTYHLAPTQLQTFLGQNNVWSNADYVEVEYDLHETQTILERKAFILANQAKIKTASGAPATFTTTTHAPLKMAKVGFLPQQTGTGTPLPSNIRPVLGWKQAGLVINRGVNLLNEATLVPDTGINADGGNTTWNTTKTNDFLYLPPGDYILTGTYTGSDSSANLRVHGYNPERNWVKQITYQSKGPNQSYSIKFTMTADMPYMRFSANKDVANIQIEAGSTATTYEPFSGRELSVSWGETEGIIYGGYIDLVSGELVQTHYKINLDGTTIDRKINHDYSDETYIVGGIVYLNPNGLSDNFSGTSKIYCNKMPIITIGTTSPSVPFVRTINAGNQYLRFYLALTADHPELDTAQKRIDFCNNYLANNLTIVVYPLSTPIVHQLTPSQIKDFLGSNTVSPYSNSIVEVQYWTH